MKQEIWQLHWEKIKNNKNVFMLSIEHHGLKECGGVEAYLHTFLTFVLL
jgi:hypothetical protein